MDEGQRSSLLLLIVLALVGVALIWTVLRILRWLVTAGVVLLIIGFVIWVGLRFLRGRSGPRST